MLSLRLRNVGDVNDGIRGANFLLLRTHLTVVMRTTMRTRRAINRTTVATVAMRVMLVLLVLGLEGGGVLVGVEEGPGGSG